MAIGCFKLYIVSGAERVSAFVFLLYHTFGLKTRPERKIFTLPLFTLLPRAGYILVVCLFVGFRPFIKDGFSACRCDRNMERASGRAGNVSPSVPGHGTTLSFHCGKAVPRVYTPVRPSLRRMQARDLLLGFPRFFSGPPPSLAIKDKKQGLFNQTLLFFTICSYSFSKINSVV